MPENWKSRLQKNENSRDSSHPRRNLMQNWVNDLRNAVVNKLEKLQSLIQAIFYQTNEKWFTKYIRLKWLIIIVFQKYIL